MKSLLLAVAATLVVFAGCASTEAPAGAAQVSTTDRVYRPGSNLLVRDRTPMTQEEKERQADEARKALESSPRPTVIR